MYATVDNLLTFGNALIRGEVFDERERRLMSEPLLDNGPASPWAPGWILGTDTEGRRTVHITAATPGVQAAPYVYSDDDLVFAMLANCWGKGSAGGALVTSAPQAVIERLLAATRPGRLR